MDDVWALIRQGVAADEARPIDMLKLFESPETRNVPDIAGKANLFKRSFEPPVCTLTPLAAAAIFGRNAVVTGLLGSDDYHLDVDTRDHMRRTPLMLAARYGNESTVLTLLHEGAHRYKRDARRRTATDLAIQVGQLQIAGIINADPERVPLVEVAAEGKLVLALGLLKQGVSAAAADTDSRCPYGTPLIAACANGHERMVSLLLKQDGVDVNQRNRRGETALMRAAQAGALGICRKLIQAGAQKDLLDHKGLSAEHHAYKCSHVNMVLYKGLSGVAHPPRAPPASAEGDAEKPPVTEPQVALSRTSSSASKAVSSLGASGRASRSSL
eukprot:TRINITY_DN2402_c0_g1_i3.p1 TRINITY_DN2402_c0_g1~~TRINITY_DN2402_c0_g1_i3.p1  ORF type:complete len:328 (+),score=121.27 TRINITY_DN2402_c0_g1_i3:826-1809(+)